MKNKYRFLFCVLKAISIDLSISFFLFGMENTERFPLLLLKFTTMTFLYPSYTSLYCTLLYLLGVTSVHSIFFFTVLGFPSLEAFFSSETYMLVPDEHCYFGGCLMLVWWLFGSCLVYFYCFLLMCGRLVYYRSITVRHHSYNAPVTMYGREIWALLTNVPTINRPIDPSIKNSVKKSIINRSTNQVINQSITDSSHQLTNIPTNQSAIIQSINRPTNKPTNQPTNKPTTQSIS